jgi:predicted dinucleotide-binding enzyme
MPTLKVGILGAGALGQALATRLARAGVQVVIGNSRGPDSLVEILSGLGAGVVAGTREEVVEPEIVFLAVPWLRIPIALADLPQWDGRILIDATNPDKADLELAGVTGQTSSQIVEQLAPGGRLVKAFNTLKAETLLSDDPHQQDTRRVVFYSGDHGPSKAELARLIRRLGFAGVDLGGLTHGGRLQQPPGGPLSCLNLIQLD